ncbi:LysR family transcriptional regulator [Neorhizobium sp. LMR1-1-1.1]
MRFDLTDLRLFLHVVEAESITQGAERAGMALASASARVRGMEETSGVSLLDRGPRGVRPTAAGEALAHHARLVLGQMEQMRGDLQLYARGLRGKIRLFTGRAAMAHLPAVLQRYLSDNSPIDIDLEERQSVDVVAAVAGAQADLGIAADTTDTGALETRPFAINRLVLTVPQEHRFGDRKSVAFSVLFDQTCQNEAALAAPTSYARMDGTNGYINSLGICRSNAASPGNVVGLSVSMTDSGFQSGRCHPCLFLFAKNDPLLAGRRGPVSATLFRTRPTQDRLR